MKKKLFIAFFTVLAFSINHSALAYLADNNIIEVKAKIKSIQENRLNVNGLKLSFQKTLISKIKKCRYKKCIIIYDKKTNNIISIKPLKKNKKGRY
jgi:hypothetical protein